MHKEKNNNPTLLLIAVVAVAVIVLISKLTPKTIDHIDIAYATIEAQAKAEELSYSDSSFIRCSGLTGQNMKDAEELTKTVSDAIKKETGYFCLDSLEKTASDTVKLTLSIRTPYAVLVSGGGYMLIDKEGTILEISEKEDYFSEEFILVEGISIGNASRGQEVNIEGTLQKSLGVVQAIKDGGYTSLYRSVQVKDYNQVELVTRDSALVRFNLMYDTAMQLAEAASVLQANEGIKGSVQVADTYAFFKADEDIWAQTPTGN